MAPRTGHHCHPWTESPAPTAAPPSVTLVVPVPEKTCGIRETRKEHALEAVSEEKGRRSICPEFVHFFFSFFCVNSLMR